MNDQARKKEMTDISDALCQLCQTFLLGRYGVVVIITNGEGTALASSLPGYLTHPILKQIIDAGPPVDNAEAPLSIKGFEAVE